MVMLFGLLKADENAAITSWLFCNSEATVPQLDAQAGILKAVPEVIDDAVGDMVGDAVGDIVLGVTGALVGLPLPLPLPFLLLSFLPFFLLALLFLLSFLPLEDFPFFQLLLDLLDF